MFFLSPIQCGLLDTALISTLFETAVVNRCAGEYTSVSRCRRMCVDRKKCITLLYNFLISICTKRKQGSDTNKTRTKHKRTTRDVSQYSAQKAAIRCQRSWWRPRSSSVVSQLHGRRSGGSKSTTSLTASTPSCTEGEAANLTRRRPWRGCHPASRRQLNDYKLLAGHVAIKRLVCLAKSTDMPRAATHWFYSSAVTWSTLSLSL